MHLLSTFLLLLMFLPLLASLALMPYLTRETVSFGVSVSEEQYWSEPLRRLRRLYASISGTIYSLLLIACFVSLWNKESNEQGLLFAIYLGVVLVISTGLYLTFYFRMKKLRPSLPAASSSPALISVDTGFRRQRLALSDKWFLIHAVIIVVSCALTLSQYASIPDTVAMKFNFSGEVVRSAAKSYPIVLFPNVVQVILTLLFWLVNWSIHHSKQQLQASDPERSLRQNAAFRRRWSVFTVTSSMALILMFSFIQVNMIRPMDIGVITLVSLAVPVFIVLFAVVLTFTTGQGGSRIGRGRIPGNAGTASVQDDRYWKLGAIYFNPQDPTLFVEKRNGIGWTMNFANPIAWLTLLGILVFIAWSAWLAK